MLAANPLDYDSRRKIADLLLALGDQAGAAEVYRVVAMHDVRSGHLLPGIVGCKVLESLGGNSDEIVAVMAATYAHDAKALAKFAARQAPVDLDAEIAPIPADAAGDPARGRRPGARVGPCDLSAFVAVPGAASCPSRSSPSCRRACFPPRSSRCAWSARATATW